MPASIYESFLDCESLVLFMRNVAISSKWTFSVDAMRNAMTVHSRCGGKLLKYFGKTVAVRKSPPHEASQLREASRDRTYPDSRSDLMGENARRVTSPSTKYPLVATQSKLPLRMIATRRSRAPGSSSSSSSR